MTKYKVPAIMTVYNNNAWGMIPAANTPRSAHMYLFQENLRYDRIAEALGARGEYVATPDQYKAPLQRVYDAAVKDKVATLINVQSSRQFLTNAFPPGSQPRNVEPGVTAYAH
jgi:acetolactate synthase I/II/III large subunit